MLNLIVALLVTFLTYIAYTALYKLYFHPLAKYPGPPLGILSIIVQIFYFATGRQPQKIEQLHLKYGEVVRLETNHLAFFTPDARQDIYSHNKSKVFIKDPKAYKPTFGDTPDLLTAGDEDHRRYRALVSHAFADRALREQQPIISSHVDLLMQRLREVSKEETPVDIHKWFKYTTFDLIGDLAFGESFGCLENSEYDPWVNKLLPYLKAQSLITVLNEYSMVGSILPWITKLLSKTIIEHTNMTRDKVQRRLATQTTRKDYLHFILRHNDENGMNQEELTANMALIILAGSETTTTTLASTVYLLLKHPDILKRLQSEVRSNFRGVGDMTMERLADFKFLDAVVQESLRVHPPGPGGLPRLATEDAIVAGYRVPKGSTVSLEMYAAFRSPQNFTRPAEFDPLRWTDEGRHEKDRLDTLEPFSTGPRNCIGKGLAWAEVRLILTRLLFEFDLELLDDGFNHDKQKVYVLWDNPPLNVRLRPRSGI